MKNKLNIFFKFQSNIFRLFLLIISVFLIVLMIPKKGNFQYEYNIGKPWKYDTLIAPFDFEVIKSNDEIELETQLIRRNTPKIYIKNEYVKDSINSQLNNNLRDSISANSFIFLKNKIEKLYNPGLIDGYIKSTVDSIIIINGNKKTRISTNMLSNFNMVSVDSSFKSSNQDSLKVSNFLKQNIIPDIIYDKILSDKNVDSLVNKVSIIKGNFINGVRIIARGEIVNEEKNSVLESLKFKFESQLLSKSNLNLISVGYYILVFLMVTLIFLYLKKNHSKIFVNNTKMTFVFAIVLIFTFLVSFVTKYQPEYVYIVPLCSVPLLIRAFFDAKLGLFIHLLILLIVGFIVPNNYEFVIINLIAGIVAILSPSDIYQRANLFKTVALITIVYVICYSSLRIVLEGNLFDLNLNIGLLFALNGLATLFVHPSIYIFEKLFGLVSDVSLLELTDTNTKLMKELSEKAPGTFYHSLAVSNLAEAVAVQISANVMLVRVGALYHDIGKMVNPNYFIENQTGTFNPHDELSPDESVKIIKDHIAHGISIAKSNRLPDRVIDFIRTHHGTSILRFFYEKALKSEINTEDSSFRYLGPKPFSKETAILMMADSVEAASKSLKNPNVNLIDQFVEKIINKQIDDNQFINCDITLKELEISKKILKEKLNNIYHLRVEYPD